jgi:hypothetical protein
MRFLAQYVSLSILISAVAPSMVRAQADKRWVEISAPDRLYLDSETIKVDGAARVVWTNQRYSKPGVHGGTANVMSIKAHYRIDCAENQILILGLVMYDRLGSVLNSFTNPVYEQQLEDPVPETVGDLIVKYVCHMYPIAKTAP